MWWRSVRTQFLIALLLASAVSVSLFMYGALDNHSFREFSYLPFNLVLAWLPFIFAIRLTYVLKNKLWSSWEGLAMSTLWLIFLPNSFYMISDFIHLQAIGNNTIMYDTLLFTVFISTGVALGFTSLYLVHNQLYRRLTAYEAHIWAAATLLISSCAIYLGRDLRWNSWDIITNPGGLLFDIADSIEHPSAHPQMVMTIIVFFIVLCTMYGLLYCGATVLRKNITPTRQVRYLALFNSKRRGGDPLHHPLLKEHLVFLGYCHIPGQLKKDSYKEELVAGTGDVVGELYMLKDLHILPQLDDYAAGSPAQKKGLRRILVELNRPRVLAWVYFSDVPQESQMNLAQHRIDNQPTPRVKFY
jgi:uncharacterized membrane protein/gamma-glutamylcyclotransferase (GGCT)/AIG2-like uncharacterized protein YtfP